MTSKLTSEQIDRWRIRAEEAQSDTGYIHYHQERDAKRWEVLPDILKLLEKFQRGDIDVEVFRAEFDRNTRTVWDYFGFKGMSGAMFLNTLVKHIPDQDTLQSQLREVLNRPDNEAQGRRQMEDFHDYLAGLRKAGEISRRQVQAARIPFFVGGWWHLQELEAWPIYYTSGRRALEQDGLFQTTKDAVADYFRFRATFLALAEALEISSWEMEHLLVWFSEESREGPPAVVGPVVEEDEGPALTEPVDEPGEGRKHTYIQWLLARMGRKLGCRVWIASNDHNDTWNGQRLGELSMADLPGLGLDSDTRKIIRLIDVIWIKGERQIAAAFEIESTTSVYSGLLRMSDLVVVDPNHRFPLYIVAPESRIEKVKRELSRPTFQFLELHEVCGFFSFEDLEREAEGIMRWAGEPSAIKNLARKVETIGSGW